MPKIALKNGTLTIIKWSPMETAIATMRYGLTNGCITNKELSSEIAFNALSISITTKTESDRVDALTLPTVKYVHGFWEKSRPSIKLTG